MPRWQFAPFFFATAAIAAWHEVLVAIDGVTLAFDPPSITAVANDAIHFVVPDSKMMLVQAKSLAEPCTALSGGFRSVLGLGKLDVTINDTTPFYVYADPYCTRGMVFLTNAANPGDYDTLLANARALAGPDAEPEDPPTQNETTPPPPSSSAPPSSSKSNSETSTSPESSHETSPPSPSGPVDTPAPSNSETAVAPSESSGPPTGVIAAVAAICVLGTALVAAVAFICVRRRRRSRVSRAAKDENWTVEWPPPNFRPHPFTTPSSVQTEQGTSVQGTASFRTQTSEKTALRLAAATASTSRPWQGEFDSPQPSPSLLVRDSMAGSSSGAPSSSGDSDASRKLEMVQELLERGVSNRAVLTALRTVNGEVFDDHTPVSAAPRMSMLKGPPPTYAP